LHLGFDIFYSYFFVWGVQVNFRIDQIISRRSGANEGSYTRPVLGLRSVLITGNYRPASQVQAFNRKQNISFGYCPGVKNLHFYFPFSEKILFYLFYFKNFLYNRPLVFSTRESRNPKELIILLKRSGILSARSLAGDPVFRQGACLSSGQR